MDEQDLLTTEQAMEYLGISRATFWALLKRYQVPTYKIPLRGKRSFYRREDLDKLRKPYRADEGKAAA